MDFFLPYQYSIINDTAPRIVIEKSRRIGVSFCLAYKLFRRHLKSPHNSIISSSNYNTGKEFLKEIKKFIYASNIACSTDVVPSAGMTQESITFPNNSKIMVVSSEPKAFRGLGGRVILDEFAFALDQQELLAAATACSDWAGGEITICSTHNGTGTIFNTLVTNTNYKHYRITIEDAVREGLAEKNRGSHSTLSSVAERGLAYIKDKRDAAANQEIYDQEYMCSPLGSSSIISQEMYNKCIIPEYVVGRSTLGDVSRSGAIFLGIDVGRNRDSTVIWALELGTDYKQLNPKLRRVYRTIMVKSIKDMSFEQQYEVICGLIGDKVKKVCIERNGLGIALAEQLSKRYYDKVIPFDTTSSSKGLVVERLAGWIAQERLTLPCDADVKEDILAMQRIVTPTGKIGYEGRTATSHCDAFMSLAFSLHAAENEEGFFDLSSLTQQTLGHKVI